MANNGPQRRQPDRSGDVGWLLCLGGVLSWLVAGIALWGMFSSTEFASDFENGTDTYGRGTAVTVMTVGGSLGLLLLAGAVWRGRGTARTVAAVLLAIPAAVLVKLLAR